MLDLETTFDVTVGDATFTFKEPEALGYYEAITATDKTLVSKLMLESLIKVSNVESAGQIVAVDDLKTRKVSIPYRVLKDIMAGFQDHILGGLTGETKAEDKEQAAKNA